MENQPAKTASLYRMVMPKHTCPWGVKAKYLLERRGYIVEDHHLETHAATDAFKQQHGVKTTPQTFIGGERIGGYEDLRRYLGLAVRDPNAKSYRPVIAVFAVAAALATAVSLSVFGALTMRTAEWFIAFSMALLAMLKLQDVDRFATMFLGYDLLAKRWLPYAYIYPFAEALAGVLMAGHLLPWLSIPLAAFIGSVGAVSVFYAVYIQKRDLECACVGGSGRVPLGPVSLLENVLMAGMAIWMLVPAH
ncbi:MAG: glutaredoxin [Candidatus Andeanibacterium colombiense]|uniref:Methylamine utilization protein MauE n=1 Tax=Candidatus Andeanibacterium colombiense TaxID=3121345 RepID=A0AAJ5XAD6_9SPHN|nr:MAG: glutaredoxin [Sphingomonadaceae bacterium]